MAFSLGPYLPSSTKRVANLPPDGQSPQRRGRSRPRDKVTTKSELVIHQRPPPDLFTGSGLSLSESTVLPPAFPWLWGPTRLLIRGLVSLCLLESELLLLNLGSS